MLWLYIDFPKLALEAAFIGDPRPLPQLLLQPGKHTIIQCNEAAQQQGVRVGMNKKTAYCLLSECALAEYNPDHERQALKQLALRCYPHASSIRIIEPRGLLLEITSMLQLFNGLKHYLTALHRTLMNSQYQYRLSTGHTARAAEVLACSLRPCTHTHPEPHQQALLSLGVEDLKLDHKTVSKMRRMGLLNYKQLKAIPIKELGYRFGQVCVEQLDALEHDHQPTTPFQPPTRFQQKMHLHYEAAHAQGLVFPIKRCLSELEQFLSIRQLICEKLLIKLEHRDHQASLLTVHSVRGAYLESDWLALLQAHLEHTRLLSPVIGITVRAQGFLPWRAEHRDLLGESNPEQQADRLLSLLTARLGHSAVQQLSCYWDARPEKASQLHSHTPQTTYMPKQWPTLLWPEPKPINVIDYSILQGPERIDSGWWDSQSARRDYYIAERHGQVHWLFRRDDGQWFLQGEFC